MINSYQNSIIAQLLEAITGQINFTGTPTSNIGDILLSILEQTPYDKEPKSVLAELFLKLKDKLEGRAFTPYDKEPKSAIAEILLSILNETEYDKEPNSRIAELLLDLKAELESYAELTASGAIANFTTSVVKPLVNLTAYVKATQEAGTPTPQSPKAITGVSSVSVYHRGSNLWDEEWEVGGINATTGQNDNSTTCIRTKGYIPINPDTMYFPCVVGGGTSTLRTRFYDKNKNYIGSNQKDGTGVKYNTGFTSPINAYFLRFSPQDAYGTTYNHDISINYPSSDVEYHAYNNQSITEVINLGGTYYGGHFTQDKAGHRQIEVTHGIYAFDGTENFGALSSNNRVYTNILSDAYIPSGSTEKCVISTHYVGTSQNQAASGAVYKTTGNLALVFQDDVNGVDVATFKAFLANQYASNTPVTVVYKIAEPIIIDLPDGEPITAFNGVNNIYNDSGDTSVTYLAKIADNLNATAKLRAEVKAQMLKAKEEEKEIIKEEPIEEIKEPIKDSGEVKKGANKA